MNSQAPIVNVSGNYEESILRWAKHLGKDKTRRAVFDLIYGKISKPRSKKQIAELLGYSEKSQVIQDALGHLSKHHLISRVENNGQVKDGSKWLYGKDGSIRANRDKIVRFADDPAAAQKVPTMRKPRIDTAFTLVKPRMERAVRGASARQARIDTRRAKLKIALLVTNPNSIESLQTGIEARYIDEAIRMSGRSEEVDLKIFLAPTLDSLLHMLNTYKPDVIHFSGHGGGGALLFDNERAGDNGGKVLDFDMVARVVESTSTRAKLLVLVACDTASGADRFLTSIPAVIAMSDSIDDEAACEFSRRFYQSLAEGATIAQSLSQAKLVLESKGYDDADLPTLIANNENTARQNLMK